VASARKSQHLYAHECSDDFHRRLLELLLTVEGAVVLSAYNSEIYQPLAQAGWAKREWQTACHMAARGRGSKIHGLGSALKHAPRTEVLWINPRAVALLREQGKFNG
jgi:DNA adenine methylase